MDFNQPDVNAALKLAADEVGDMLDIDMGSGDLSRILEIFIDAYVLTAGTESVGALALLALKAHL